MYISSYGVTVGLKRSVRADFFLGVSRRDDEDEMGKLLFAPRLCLWTAGDYKRWGGKGGGVNQVLEIVCEVQVSPA